jgi:hypothetical protein
MPEPEYEVSRNDKTHDDSVPPSYSDLMPKEQRPDVMDSHALPSYDEAVSQGQFRGAM